MIMLLRVGSYSNTGATEQIVLNYTGIVKIGFLATTSATTPDIDFHIDNFSVTSLCTPIIWYADADGDGYGNAAMSVEACDAPEGYVDNSTDCDDTDELVWRNGTFFIDNDGDGHTFGEADLCYGESIPEGYTEFTAGMDCDDNNASVWQTGDVYVDADGDGYTTSNSTTRICYGLNIPAGYTLEFIGIDCDDNDATAWQSATVYIDMDGDGFYGEMISNYCYGASLPLHYSLSTLGFDCNDNNSEINPNATEIPNNGIDENCHGMQDDEVLTGITTTIRPDFCGSTLIRLIARYLLNL